MTNSAGVSSTCLLRFELSCIRTYFPVLSRHASVADSAVPANASITRLSTKFAKRSFVR